MNVIEDVQKAMRELVQSTVVAKVELKIAYCESFKIGKTGQTKDERFAGYKGEYEEYSIVYEGSRKEVSDMESYLIKHYKDNPKCDNYRGPKASNKDEMKEDSVNFHVYVVWNRANNADKTGHK